MHPICGLQQELPLVKYIDLRLQGHVHMRGIYTSVRSKSLCTGIEAHWPLAISLTTYEAMQRGRPCAYASNFEVDDAQVDLIA